MERPIQIPSRYGPLRVGCFGITVVSLLLIGVIIYSSFSFERTVLMSSSTHEIIKQIPSSSPSDTLDSKISGVSGKLFLGEKIRSFEKPLLSTELIKHIGIYSKKKSFINF